MELVIKNASERLVKMLPEKISISETESIVVRGQRVVLTDFGEEIAIGYAVEATKRTIEKKEKAISVHEIAVPMSEFICISKNSSFGEFIDVANSLVDKIYSQLVGKDN